MQKVTAGLGGGGNVPWLLILFKDHLHVYLYLNFVISVSRCINVMVIVGHG